MPISLFINFFTNPRRQGFKGVKGALRMETTNTHNILMPQIKDHSHAIPEERKSCQNIIIFIKLNFNPHYKQVDLGIRGIKFMKMLEQ